MSKKLNTTYTLETNDGGELKLTLAYRYLYQLRAKHKAQYDEYNRIMTKGAQDEFDNLTILYTAYLCHNIAVNGDTDDCMGFDDFLDLMPYDREDIGKAVGMLIAPKKTMASAALS